MPKFTSKEDVARWLNATSPGVSQVFAARAALRALPALAFTFGLHGNQLRSPEHPDVALRTFRCAQVAWAYSAYPSHSAVLKQAALVEAPLTQAPNPERSAAYAAAVAARNNHGPEFARVAANDGQYPRHFLSFIAPASCTPVRRGSCGECAQCLDDQVALGFCRRKQIDVLFCRSDVGVARWQSGNLFCQLARRPLKVESQGAVPFLLGGGPVTTWMGAVGLSINCFLACRGCIGDAPGILCRGRTRSTRHA